ncbi:MAG TPA: hydroxymethylbilane synthase [Pirellulales bacterium]|jgi:hydroxymethylbilane synthase|nr:hydroxymethylbilane synthase [Pirellulales bacterium]
MSFAPSIRIGTRSSPLARWQAQWVSDALVDAGRRTELVPITTRGDVQQLAPVEQLGTRGVFTKELQRALLANEIDVAVHSLKDLPTEAVPGLILAAVPKRETPLDVVVSRDGSTLTELPAGARIGTGSLRRQSQLLHLRPDLSVSQVRGNVDTRLRKLDEGQFDALILAEAGLRRLGLAHRVTQVLGPDQMLPAVGQGALGLETRAADHATREAVAALDHPASHLAVLAERSLLDSLEGGCLAPIGALATIDSTARMRLQGVVLSRDGFERLHASVEENLQADVRATAGADRAIEVGRRLAAKLLEQGAGSLILAARDERPA